MSDESQITVAKRESARCEKHVSSGGARDFWRQRIGQKLSELDEARRVLQERLDWLEVSS